MNKQIEGSTPAGNNRFHASGVVCPQTILYNVKNAVKRKKNEIK